MTCTPDSLLPFISHPLVAVISLIVAIFTAYINGRKGGGINFWTCTWVAALAVSEAIAVSVSIELNAWNNYDWWLFTSLLSLVIFVAIAAIPLCARDAGKDTYKKQRWSKAPAGPAVAHV